MNDPKLSSIILPDGRVEGVEKVDWEPEGRLEVVEVVLRLMSRSCFSNVLISARTSASASARFSTVSSIDANRASWNRISSCKAFIPSVSCEPACHGCDIANEKVRQAPGCGKAWRGCDLKYLGSILSDRRRVLPGADRIGSLVSGIRTGVTHLDWRTKVKVGECSWSLCRGPRLENIALKSFPLKRWSMTKSRAFSGLIHVRWDAEIETYLRRYCPSIFRYWEYFRLRSLSSCIVCLISINCKNQVIKS